MISGLDQRWSIQLDGYQRASQWNGWVNTPAGIRYSIVLQAGREVTLTRAILHGVILPPYCKDGDQRNRIYV